MDKKKKPTSRPAKNNPAGPVDKTDETRHIPGISDDTRVVYAEEQNRNDG